MLIVSGAPEVLAGGSSPVEIFALFANLCAKVSASLWRQAKAMQINQVKPKIQELQGVAGTLLLLFGTEGREVEVDFRRGVRRRR